MKTILTLFVGLLIPLFGFSQMGCGGQFYDNGGLTGDYLPDSNTTTTICPTIPGDKVTVTFTEFNTEAVHDGLYVYDGVNVVSSMLLPNGNPAGNVPGGIAGSYWGNLTGANLPGPFVSSTMDGCLTFVFRSDATVQSSGWIANVTCGPPLITSGFLTNPFLDINSNATQDTGELSFPFGDVGYQINGGVQYYLWYYNGIGYIPEDNPGNTYDFTYTLYPEYSAMYTVATPSYTGLTIGTSTGLIPVNFPITSLESYSDLGVTLFPLNSARAGFNYVNRLSYTNYSNQTIANGSLAFTNDAALTLSSTSETVSSTASGFTYNFSNLLPFETRYIDVTLSVPSIPNVYLNQILTNSASISTSVIESSLTNNTSTLDQIIVASYDPNDITESHGSEIVYSTFAADDYLTYTIRFENTGTAPATNVLVTDALDSQIDETSIRMISASDAYVLERVGTTLSWKFDNIELPVSVADTNIGKGYITFKAKLKPGFAVGTTVPNMAKIYFDTNPAIDTNTFTTEFVTALATSDFTFENYLSIYPNPAKNSLTISTKQNVEISEVNIYNVLGQLVETMTHPTNTIDVSSLKTGNYFIKISSDKGSATGKFIKE